MLTQELKWFRENIAEPRMKQLLENIHIPDGMCCINNLEISFLDGRSCGVEYGIKASGLICTDGKVEEYSYEEYDVPVSEFADEHKHCIFLSDGTLRIRSELDETEISSVLRQMRFCAQLFPELSQADGLRIENKEVEFLKMMQLHQDQLSEQSFLKVQTDYPLTKADIEPDSGTAWDLDFWDGETVRLFLDWNNSGNLYKRFFAFLEFEQGHLDHPEDSLDIAELSALYNVRTGEVSIRCDYTIYDAGYEYDCDTTIPLTADEQKCVFNAIANFCTKTKGVSFDKFIDSEFPDRVKPSLSSQIASAAARTSADRTVGSSEKSLNQSR